MENRTHNMAEPVEKKDWGMVAQKDLMKSYYDEVRYAREEGKKVVYTFIPGNLIELLSNFDLVTIYPELLGLQMGLRQSADKYINLGEKEGYADEVCSYVKSSVGMAAIENMGPQGYKIPEPDFLFLVHNSCFTFMKWWEILRRKYKCPIVEVHLPFSGNEGKISKESIKYGVKQFKEVVIPKLEELTGKKFDIDKLKERLRYSAEAEENYFHSMNTAKNTPCPYDAGLNGIYYVGPINSALRGTPQVAEYYKKLRKYLEQRVSRGEGPITSFGQMNDQKYRIVLEGLVPWMKQDSFYKILYDEKVVLVGASYLNVGGLYDLGEFSSGYHDPSRPLESLCEQVTNCLGSSGINARLEVIMKEIQDYNADGFMVNSIKSCKAFITGQLVMIKELERRTGMPGAFFESDMMDARFYSDSNIKNRIESYLRMIDQKWALGEAR